jgi:hypothetical protein
MGRQISSKAAIVSVSYWSIMLFCVIGFLSVNRLAENLAKF